MENPTSFDLNFAIKHWRSALEQSPAMQGAKTDRTQRQLANIATPVGIALSISRISGGEKEA